MSRRLTREMIKKNLIAVGIVIILLMGIFLFREFKTNSITSGIIKNDVPFIAQAPLGEWSDIRQQDGCEEASAIMAVAWAKNIQSIEPTDARVQILAIADWEDQNYNNHRDTSTNDTAQRIIKKYLKYTDIKFVDQISADNIVEALAKGSVVIIPTDGSALNNPYYAGPGPERHMLLVIGYDFDTKEFITHDPGTSRGANYRYGKDMLYNAIRDYTSSENNSQMPIKENVKNMIVVSK